MSSNIFTANIRQKKLMTIPLNTKQIHKKIKEQTKLFFYKAENKKSAETSTREPTIKMSFNECVGNDFHVFYRYK